MAGILEGKVAIVTGSGRGIGRAIAERFGEAGAAVVVATRTASDGLETVDRIARPGGRATFIQTALRDRDDVSGLVDAALRLYGRLDIAVHNAAFIPVARIADISDADLDQSFAVNVKAGIWLTQAALAPMRAQGEGRILFTSSVTAQRAYPTCGAYAASKAALNGFIRAAALELGPDRITVNGVEPGIIATPALSRKEFTAERLARIASYIPLRRLGTAMEVADAMLFLASPGASYVTGQLLVVDGGVILPENGAFLVEDQQV